MGRQTSIDCLQCCRINEKREGKRKSEGKEKEKRRKGKKKKKKRGRGKKNFEKSWQWWAAAQRKKILRVNHSTQDSRVVPHRGTN
jgi:hypothetical protein